MADVGFGTTITFGTSGFTAELRSVNGPSMDRPAIDTSHMTTAGGKRTFIPSDLTDHGEVELEILFDPDTEPPIDLVAEQITITYPVPAGQTNGATYVFSGFVTAFEPSAPYDDLMTGSITIKVSGDITYAQAS